MWAIVCNKHFARHCFFEAYVHILIHQEVLMVDQPC